MARKIPRKIKVKERKLGREGAYGQAWKSAALIEIDPRQTERARLDTLIHETLHVILPDHSDTAIRGLATRMVRVIWKDGWRRVRGI